MERRRFIISLIIAPALGLLAACGSDAAGDRLPTPDTASAEPPTTDAPPPTETVPSTEAPAETAEPPVDEESTPPATAEPVLTYTTPGGFTTQEFAFQNPPIVLITADGTMLTGAVTTAVFPGPLVPQHQTQTVSADGIEALRAAADAAGLLAEVDYGSEEALLIADAPTSVLAITVDGTTYTHEADALGIGGGPGAEGTESTPERQALLEFLTQLEADPASIVGAANLGAPTPYQPTAYHIVAGLEDGDLAADTAIEPWPADTGIDLASTSECTEIPRDAVGDLFDDAEQFTYFEQGREEIYYVTVRPAYPGRSC